MTDDPRPRPQYGEYAPPGWVSPAESAQPADPAELPPPVAPAAIVSALVRPTPGWDRTLTIALLIVGLFGALTGWLTGSSLSESLSIALVQYGIQPGTMADWLDGAGTALSLSHVLLYLAALALSIALLVRGRRAFWVPLTAGVVAAIIFWSVMSAAVAPYAEQLQP